MKKQNYRSVSILTNLSKMYERSMLKKMFPFLKIHFLNTNVVQQFNNIQQFLLTLLAKWKNAFDKS